MRETKNDDERMERVMNQLADSALALSDTTILTEFIGVGEDPNNQLESVRSILRGACRSWDRVNRRLSDLGHLIDLSNWRHSHDEYTNRCVACGYPVAFLTGTGELLGEASNARCRGGSQYEKSAVVGSL
jgi:hypothetical protein